MSKFFGLYFFLYIVITLKILNLNWLIELFGISFLMLGLIGFCLANHSFGIAFAILILILLNQKNLVILLFKNHLLSKSFFRHCYRDAFFLNTLTLILETLMYIIILIFLPIEGPIFCKIKLTQFWNFLKLRYKIKDASKLKK